MEINEIMNKINDGEYVYVPSNLAIGKVKKVVIDGPINLKEYECGYLYLEKNSGIKKHMHVSDVEKYELIKGTLSVLNNKCDTNICKLGEEHDIDAVLEDTIVKYTKVVVDDNNLVNDLLFERVYKK